MIMLCTISIPKHKPSSSHGFKLVVISIEPGMDKCCKNGWETGWDYWRNQKDGTKHG